MDDWSGGGLAYEESKVISALRGWVIYARSW
jgi:hypothetical protein